MITIGMLLFDGFTQLDLTGPLEIFSRFPNSRIYLLSKTLDPVQSKCGLKILPDTTFNQCPKHLSVFFVPGGPGIDSVLKDDVSMAFVRSRVNDDYITAVCTGSLVLGAAGLLKGFRATTHWLSMDLLRSLGVTEVHERVVVDGNRITGAGVTSGIDFALLLASIMVGDQCAREIQLQIEYDPQPPLRAGHPSLADPETVAELTMRHQAAQDKRMSIIKDILSRGV